MPGSRITSPFKVQCSAQLTSSPLKIGGVVEAVGMAPEDDCQHELMALYWQGESLAVQLDPTGSVHDCNQKDSSGSVFGGRHYWVPRAIFKFRLKKMSEQVASIHRLRIALDHVEPPIWRSIETASDTPLDLLASYIRCAFGWSCTHACMFTIKRRHYGTHNDWASWDPEQEFEDRRRKIEKQQLGPKERNDAMNQLFDSWKWAPQPTDEGNTVPLLGELARRVGAKFTFVFDFGDRWTHTIRVEKIEPALLDAVYPRCIAGEGTDPLEDCGGPWNLMEVFAAVMQPEQPRNETIRHIVANWVGEGWDFTRFSVEEVNKRFRKTISYREETSHHPG